MSAQPQPTYDGCLPNFFHSKTDGTRYVDSIGETLNSPEFLKDGIAFLKSEISEHRKGILEAEEDLQRKNVALAAAYAKPEYDRRRPHDDANVTLFETVCRIIEPSVILFRTQRETGWYVAWDLEDRTDCTLPMHTQQEAWRAAFNSLDRRKVVQP